MPVVDCATGETRDYTPEELAALAPTFAELKTTKLEATKARSVEAFGRGYTPATGTLAGKTLQVRNSEDRTNWLTSSTSYGAAIAGGMGATVGAMFRTADNETFMLTFNEGYQVLVVGMAAWGQSIYARLWALKDEIEAAADQAALDAIDITAGWPA